MKRLPILTCLCLLFFVVSAHNTADLGKITLSVVMPDNVEGLNETQLSKIETKITQIVSSAGIGAGGYDNSFVIYPKFSITDTKTVESGSQEAFIVTCEINLFIRQVETKMIFSSISKQVRGTGKDKASAITNAIDQININDAEILGFVQTGKTSIISYYESKYRNIMAKSESMVKLNNYEAAISILLSVPQEASRCYKKVQAKAVEVFIAYQNARCQAQVQKARTAIAGRDYNDALKLLSSIDPSASCFASSQSIIKSIETKVDADEKRNWELLKAVYGNEAILEKQRIGVMKDIGAAFYQNQTKVSYNLIVF